MTIRELIAVLEEMDQDRNIISTVKPWGSVRGVGTVTLNDEPIAVIR